MYSNANMNEGLPPRLYRSTAEIRRDMAVIAAKVRDTEEMLSVHNLLIEMIPTWAEQSPRQWIPELLDTLSEAEAALENLRRLKLELEALANELEEVRCLLTSR